MRIRWRKRFFAMLALVLTLAMLPVNKAVPVWAAASGAQKKTVSVTLSIGKKKITKKTYTMVVKTKKTLKVTASARVKNVQFKSSNKKVASVSKKGVIQAKKPGTARITVTVWTKRWNGKSWMKVKVNAKKPDSKPQPSETPTPEPSQTPETSEAPASSQKPEASEKPEASQKPGASEKPASSQKPEASEKPEASQKPEASEKPEASQKPEASEKPEASQKPEASEKPEASQKPEASETPEPIPGGGQAGY